MELVANRSALRGQHAIVEAPVVADEKPITVLPQEVKDPAARNDDMTLTVRRAGQHNRRGIKQLVSIEICPRYDLLLHLANTVSSQNLRSLNINGYVAFVGTYRMKMSARMVLLNTDLYSDAPA